jgi:hypothetical protein
VRYIRRFGRFWWEFVVGDDWRVALGLALAVGLCAALAQDGIAAWWVLPPAVVLVLAGSLRRAARDA